MNNQGFPFYHHEQINDKFYSNEQREQIKTNSFNKINNEQYYPFKKQKYQSDNNPQKFNNIRKNQYNNYNNYEQNNDQCEAQHQQFQQQFSLQSNQGSFEMYVQKSPQQINQQKYQEQPQQYNKQQNLESDFFSNNSQKQFNIQQQNYPQQFYNQQQQQIQFQNPTNFQKNQFTQQQQKNHYQQQQNQQRMNQQDQKLFQQQQFSRISTQEIQENFNIKQNDQFGFVEIQMQNNNLNNLQKINIQQVQQNFQVPQSIITQIKKEEQFQNLYIQFHKLIDSFFQYADIEIKITNIDQIVKSRLNIIQEELSSLKLKIQHQCIDQEEYNQQQRIYQVKEQQENNISQLDKMTILHSNIIEKFYRDAENINVRIMINYKKFQYKISLFENQRNDSSANNLYKDFKQTWDSYFILSIQFQSEFEAKQKKRILNGTRIKQSLCKELEIKDLMIILASELNLKELELCQTLYEQGVLIKQQNNQIFLIAQFNPNINISDQQKKFENFLQNSQNVNSVKDTFDIDYSIPQDINDIDRCIQKLQAEEEEIQITVTIPQFNAQNKGKYLVHVELQIWIESYQPEKIIKQKFTQVRQKLDDIYHPKIIIKIVDEKKIKLWNKVLGSFFENKNNSKECITKQIENTLIIELNGESEMIYEKKNKIYESLEHFSCEIIKYQCDNQIAKVLKSKEAQFSRLFKKEFTEIAEEFGDCLILMINVDEKKSIIECEIYFNSLNFLLKKIKERLVQYFDNMDCFDLKIDYKEFLIYYDLKGNQFQDEYQVAVQLFDQKPGALIVGQKQNLEELQKMQKQYEYSKKQDQTSISIECENILIFNRLKQLHSQKKDNNNDNLVISFPQQNKIMIQASKKQIEQEKDKIIKQIYQLKNEIQTKICSFSDKEIKFIEKNFKVITEKLQKNNEIIISTCSSGNQNQIQTQPEQQVACTLEYQNKKIQIIYADISNVQCDAIVNSCNNKMSFGDPLQLSGVAQSIFQMGGTSYQSFCLDFISKYYELQTGFVATYIMPIGRQIKYILNVATPIYSYGDETDADLNKIKNNIEAIFEEIKNLDVEILTLPIFGGGACGYSFEQAAQVVLNTTINQLYSDQNTIKTIYIAELSDIKIQQLTSILKQILQPSNKEREVKYQWQWKDSNSYKDYDDEDINKQIDEVYEQFQLTNQEQKVLLKFPYSKQPGTHFINFDQNKVIDISLQTEFSLVSKIVSNTRKYYFGQEELDDQLNEYLMLQEINNVHKFTIFYKKHFVVFKQGEMYQMNYETQFKRKIKPTQYSNSRKQSKKQTNYLIDKKYNFYEPQYQISKLIYKRNKSNLFTLFSFDGNFNEQVFKQIKSELDKSILSYSFDVPNLSNEELEQFQEFVEQISLQTQGKFLQGQQITCKIFEKKQKKISNYIESMKKQVKQYPKEWKPQNKNFIKVSLQPGTQEYQRISDLFRQTENGTIYKIYRIQNKSLWDNYIIEKNNVIEINKQQNRILNPLEINRYLWHGVRNQHPKVIYQGLKEAFDQTYSQKGLWGAGIYFAEKASYSRKFSYQLQMQDDPKNLGKLVFLCCLVTTGKVETKLKDDSIRRPSPGYDCVSGFTNDSNVFILYSMDIRRAYPAYEIIYL